MIKKIKPASSINGSPIIPGDKSISHRGLIFGALAQGTTEVVDILTGEDVISTSRVLQMLGVKIYADKNTTFIEGIGQGQFINTDQILDCGNSGTTMRILMGVLCAYPYLKVTLTGDESLIKRPMKRVATPLSLMGAKFNLTQDNFAPLTIFGQELQAINYELKIASAQIKSAIMMAAINASGTTRLFGEIGSRDHTERLLPHFGVNLKVTSNEIMIQGQQKLMANKVIVPGDPSTAAFWIAAACLLKNSHLTLNNISLNPTRIGLLKVLKRMSAKIEMKITSELPEPVGQINVYSSHLRGTEITPDEIPSLIDEIPLVAILATKAQGTTIVRGAEELRVKESDRIEAVASNLRKMGAVIETFHDGFKINGPQQLKPATIETFHDHRIAMAFSIAGLLTDGETIIEDAEAASVSYPNFYHTLQDLTDQ
jgi:3-phosphoshikimate 1-carboxyvinyltransferase